MSLPFTASEGRYEGVERTDFPIVCETCLGNSPNVRMIRAHNDKECKICMRPCTAFRWQPGRKARYKTTVICLMCAKLKNVCQVCLFDLQFGLPVQVRDKFLQDLPKGNSIGDETQGASSSSSSNALPNSRVNRDYAVDQLEKRESRGLTDAGTHTEYTRMYVSAILDRLQRSAPYYSRNNSRVCSFWLRGECNRGSSCPYRHEDPEHDTSLKHQNIRDRYMGVNDPVALKMLRRLDEKESKTTSGDNKVVVPPSSSSVGGINLLDDEQTAYGYAAEDNDNEMPSENSK